jgi:hypothetical protein
MTCWKPLFLMSLLLTVNLHIFAVATNDRDGVFNIFPSQVNFGLQVITTFSQPETVTVSNTGDTEMMILSVILGGTSHEAFIIDDENRYPLILNPGSSVHFTVTFHPILTQQYDASITLIDNLSRTEHILPLSGEGSHSFINSYPYEEGFEDTSFPPEDWSVANSANPLSGWRHSSSINPHSGDGYAVVGYRPGDHWLITPPFLVTPQGNTLRFWMRNSTDLPDSSAESILEYLDVCVSVANADTSDFDIVLHHYSNFDISEFYQEIITDLSAYAGSIIRIAFKRHSTNGKYVYLDDFSISTPEPGSLNPPTSFLAQVETNNAHLSWQIPSHQVTEILLGFQVYRNNRVIRVVDSPSVSSYTDSSLAYGYYTYKVTALYSVMESDFSNSCGVEITYGYPNLLFADSFDTYPDFATSFGSWTNLDIDESSTFNFDEITYPNMTVPKAFMIFNPTATNPVMSYLSARSGTKMLACFDSADPPNNDWLISPQLQLGTNSMISFWAKSYTAYYGLEKFNLLVSTTDLNPDSFISIIGEDTVSVPAVQWTYYEYDLSAYDNSIGYFAIQCVSDYAVAFLVDDIKIVSTNGTVGNHDDISAASQASLLGNYPNPFNPETTIRFALNHKEKVTIEVFNTRGQKIKMLLSEIRDAGIGLVHWNGKDDRDVPVASGVYFYRMKAGSFIQTKKMVILR